MDGIEKQIGELKSYITRIEDRYSKFGEQLTKIETNLDMMRKR